MNDNVAPLIWIPGIDEVKAHMEARYGDAKHERHPHGIVIVNGQEVACTLMCPHCGEHFVSRKGSGIRRSFCMRHEAVTCGKPACLKDCVDIYSEYGLLSAPEI
jgi:hypothetical protein